jgi:PBP1b-binding outer membrane lipoprotein LpoB
MRRSCVIAVVLAIAILALALAGCSQDSRAAEQKAQCFANETVIQAEMKLFKADSGLDAPIQDVLGVTHVTCPSGGTYSYDPATEIATCSVHGHK